MPQIASPPSGGLFDGSRRLRGSEPISFTATDAGGGVATASIVVDGVERDRRLLDSNNGACVVPYVFSMPCKASVTASYSFDTTTLADGPHSVVLQVRYATEVNQATYGPVAIAVDNAPLPISIPATFPSPGTLPIPGPGDVPPLAPGISDGASSMSIAPPAPNGVNGGGRALITGGGTRTIGYGRATTLRGHIHDGDGRPIGRARLDVLAAVRKAGAKTTVIGHVTTAADGSYAFRLPAGASRDVTIAYRGRSDDPEYAATQRTVVLVRAGVRLRRSTARLRNGETLTLSADVLGPHVRKRSATVAFQVKVGSRWRTFAATAVDRRGRATIRHRFRYTRTATTYRFRAKTIRTAAFPYVTGSSPATNVVVVPR